MNGAGWVKRDANGGGSPNRLAIHGSYRCSTLCVLSYSMDTVDVVTGNKRAGLHSAWLYNSLYRPVMVDNRMRTQQLADCLEINFFISVMYDRVHLQICPTHCTDAIR
jgi:hypothetical protein